LGISLAGSFNPGKEMEMKTLTRVAAILGGAWRELKHNKKFRNLFIVWFFKYLLFCGALGAIYVQIMKPPDVIFPTLLLVPGVAAGLQFDKTTWRPLTTMAILAIVYRLMPIPALKIALFILWLITYMVFMWGRVDWELKYA
jgi:hypothetical protein